MKILLEMRPALDGHAGIPQETRLLFRALAGLSEVEVSGLLLTGSRVLAHGLPVSGGAGRSQDWRINRLSRVVVSLQQSTYPPRLERLRAAMLMARLPLDTLFGRCQPLTRFEPEHFRDFIWRGLFARTLPREDFDIVTSAPYRVSRVPWSSMHSMALGTKKLGHALYSRLDTRGFDLMVAETPFPGRVRAPTKLVVRYHDAMPMLMPHTITNRSFHQASHYYALRRNVLDGAWFACVSDATRRDLISIFPQAEARAVTIHNMVSPHYRPDDASPHRIPEILRTRVNADLETLAAAAPAQPAVAGTSGTDFLLMVSTLEPRKNHLALLAAWEQLRAEQFPNLQLVFVGALGWDHEAIVARLRPWVARGALHLLEDVPAPELRLLYRHARATVCPSFGEGFDFSGIEAMRCGGAVAASDITVHHDIFGAACELFSPYSSAEMAAAIARVIAPEAQGRRDELVELGAEVSARYLPERILPQWREFLDRLAN